MVGFAFAHPTLGNGKWIELCQIIVVQSPVGWAKYRPRCLGVDMKLTRHFAHHQWDMDSSLPSSTW